MMPHNIDEVVEVSKIREVFNAQRPLGPFSPADLGDFLPHEVMIQIFALAVPPSLY